MALIDDEPRMATARATEATVLLVIPRDNFTKRLEGSDPILRRLLGILIGRVRDLTREVARRTTVVR